MNGFDLGAFLEEARAAGQQDSEGVFTLEHEKSLTKLAHFSLPSEYDWVLKIIQAVNAWRCEVLIVRQTRNATSFFFCPQPSHFPDDGDLVTSLQRGSFDKGGPVDTLCMALRSLVDQLALSFVLASRRGSKTGEPIYAGDDTSGLDESTRRQWTSMGQQGFRLTVSHYQGTESWSGRYIPHFSGLKRRDIAIAQQLTQSAYCSDTSIYLDGLRVSDVCLHPILGHRNTWRPLAFGALENDQDCDNESKLTSTFLDPKRPLYELRQPDLGLRFAPRHFYLRTMDWTQSSWMESKEGRFLSLDDNSSPMHQIIWTRYGVVALRARIPSRTTGTNLIITINGDHLRSDLTGLTLAVDDDEISRAETFLSTVAQHCVRLFQEIKLFTEDRGSVPVSVSAATTAESHDVEMEDTASFLSESLIPDVGGVSEARKRWSHGWARFLLWGRTKSQLKNWLMFLDQEIATLVSDLEDAPIKPRPTDGELLGY